MKTALITLIFFAIFANPKPKHSFQIDFDSIKRVEVVWEELPTGKASWQAYWRGVNISASLNYEERLLIQETLKKDIW